MRGQLGLGCVLVDINLLREGRLLCEAQNTFGGIDADSVCNLLLVAFRSSVIKNLL